MTPDTFTVLQGLGMVIAQVAGICLVGYVASRLRAHFVWIKRIVP